MDSRQIKQRDSVELLKELGLTKEGLESLTKISELDEVDGIMDHQLKTIYWFLKHRRALCAEKMGLGKTLSVITSALQLRKWRISKKKILFALKSRNGVGSVIADINKFTTLVTCRLSTDPTTRYDGIDVVVTTYASLLRVCTDKSSINKVGVQTLQDQFDIFIFDEVQGAKNPDTKTALSLFNLASPEKNPKAVAVFGMSGTLIGRNVADAWTPFFIIDGGRTLGNSYDQFLATYCREVKFKTYTTGEAVPRVRYDTDPRKLPDLLDRMAQGCIFYDTEEVADLPAFMFHITWYPLTGESKRMYKQLADQKAGNSTLKNQVHRSKFLQVSSGFLYMDEVEEEDRVRHIGVFKEKDKAKALMEDLDTLFLDDPTRVCLVFYYLKGSAKVLEEVFQQKSTEYVHLVPGQDIGATMNKIDYINKHSGQLVILANAASSGESLNLQRADSVLYYDVLDSVGMYLQSIYRIRRLGSRAQHLNVFFYAGESTIEPVVLKRLAKGKDISESVYNLDNVLGKEKEGRVTLSPSDFEVIAAKAKEQKPEEILVPEPKQEPDVKAIVARMKLAMKRQLIQQ